MKTDRAVESNREAHFEKYEQIFQKIKTEIGKVIIGHERMIDLMIYVLMSKGHMLIEGVPGLAKSLAVETFAKIVGGDFKRFQFTPDKMPSDVTGTMIYNEREKRFDYQYGPIFCNIFLADEINRASPKVQSALLEAMQEKRVDVERVRYDIPNPFMVLATQNPIEQIGTYPLAEAQIDRFMVKYDIVYPKNAEETELIVRKHSNFEELRAEVKTVMTCEDVLSMQRAAHENVLVTRKVMDYIIHLCTMTRPPETYKGQKHDLDIYEYIRLGASPRASEYLLALSKSRAFFHGRNYVNFDDINKCAVHILRHRILLNSKALSMQITSDMIVDEIIRNAKPY
jgi:MoxR-like ATPase